MLAQVRPFPRRPRVRLAERAPFRLGDAEVRPAEREVEGPGGVETLEPRVMQVLVALADAAGAVVSRDELIERCWDGRIVGDDAIVRTVSRLRRLADGAAAGAFAIEAITKVGYRLRAAAQPEPIAPVLPREDKPAAKPEPSAATAPRQPAAEPTTATTPHRIPRRALLAAGAASAAALAGGGLWLATRTDPRPSEAARFYAEGVRALAEGLPERDAQGIGFLREAVRLAPADAAAWGKLALAYVATAEYARGEPEQAALIRARAAAARAVELDPGQGDALAALATIPPAFGGWAEAEARLRRVLERAPGNVAASSALATTLMSVGRVRDTFVINQRLHVADPLSPVHGYRWLYSLWNAGRIEEADRVASRLRALWPRHTALWTVQWLILAFTGRAAEARAMSLDVEGRPPRMDGAMAERGAIAARALETRAAADVARAVESQFAAVHTSPAAAISAVMLLAGLGALDEAFSAAHAYLLRRGPLAPPPRPAPGTFVHNDQRHRKTMMLFVPASAPLRADPRFATLSHSIGLESYWRTAGILPDFRA